ncbi:hypothetical protein BGX38DRAFT_1227446, partial [Terfezia claveryi]
MMSFIESPSPRGLPHHCPVFTTLAEAKRGISLFSRVGILFVGDVLERTCRGGGWGGGESAKEERWRGRIKASLLGLGGGDEFVVVATQQAQHCKPSLSSACCLGSEVIDTEAFLCGRKPSFSVTRRQALEEVLPASMIELVRAFCSAGYPGYLTPPKYLARHVRKWKGLSCNSAFVLPYCTGYRIIT